MTSSECCDPIQERNEREMSGFQMGNSNRFPEITSETRGRVVQGVKTTDFFWIEGEADQKDRYRPFAITCLESMQLRVVYWGDRVIGSDGEPDPTDDSNSIVVHFVEGANSARLFKIVGDGLNTSDGGTTGEIVANR